MPEEDREHVLKVGFEWDEFGDGFKWEDIERTITLYKNLYGELPRDNFLVRCLTCWRFIPRRGCSFRDG